jgi:5'-3' exonuclease
VSDDNSVLLVDLSSFVYPLWHVSSKEPDQDWTSNNAITQVRGLASRYRHAGICVDQGRSFRKEIDPAYKANRPDRDAALVHQIKRTIDGLRKDGFAIFGVDGFEADDVIATASMQAVEQGMSVVIASADKDLLQLVDDVVGISVYVPSRKELMDEAAVESKYGIKPQRMADYLSLVGDSSDNIKGVPGIGPKKAAAFFKEHSTGMAFLTPEQTALATTAKALILLRTDCPIDIAHALTDRTPDNSHIEDSMNETLDPIVESVPVAVTQTVTPETKQEAAAPIVRVEPSALVPVAFDKALEPRGLDDARTIAKWVHASRLFGSYGSPEAVFSVIMAGRELNLGTMASLRAFHIVEGRPTLAADFIRALVLNSGKAKYFRSVERTDKQATFETHRVGEPDPIQLTYTIDEAVVAKLVREGSGWTKHRSDMLSKTASTKLARLVYPDVTFGLYSPVELGGEE